MQSFDVVDYLNGLCPPEHAESWDNVGLLVGGNRAISAVYVALDATDEVIEACWQEGCEMLITHHPLIFSGIKNVTENDFIGRRVLKLAENGISYFAMHTNYDTDLMGDLAAERIALRDCQPLLERAEFADQDEEPVGIGRIGELTEEMPLKKFAERVAAAFDTVSPHIFGDPDTMISCAAILPGSGKSGIDTAIASGADVLVTGDIDHHAGLDALAQGMAVIDAGHYGLEHIFIEDVAERLRDQFPGIRVVTDKPREPFFSV
ncbi:MAG: Nif3-like dinuclear metal center hexameric protein [Lachnospiraceae bacterium]|nr:Nif3-like dinuclear metal center hexameric protein [Lachnospiraceae bacterium]